VARTKDTKVANLALAKSDNRLWTVEQMLDQVKDDLTEEPFKSERTNLKALTIVMATQADDTDTITTWRASCSTAELLIMLEIVRIQLMKETGWL